ncbi:hypothetical protein BKH41_00810 [Helicobacter sp. 12S02232-10]|uniref:DsrE family protein n=1 Tax=Helicobacter sp. 12S02232-10 TaxID=1476197 RepID=UPI000BA79378|nr:DsrE family protein [Helicobacter sp. 12S02232-10]PAF49875.1 hypothetical protein BKH41_00810 [Helicobacter sp. 12S02232-10]
MKNKTLLFKSDKIGEGDLGKVVSAGFIGAMLKVPKEILPEKIVFLNRGVLLSTQNDQVSNKDIVENLKMLENLGVEILSCQTCLEYFGLKDKVLVGKISNAVDVMENLLGNEGVISL